MWQPNVPNQDIVGNGCPGDPWGHGRVFEIGRWGSGECHKSSEVVVVHGCEVGMTAGWERPSDGVGMGQRAVALDFLGARVASSVGGLAAGAAQLRWSVRMYRTVTRVTLDVDVLLTRLARFQPWSVDFPHFGGILTFKVKEVKFGFPGIFWKLHADVSWPPSELIRFWSWFVNFPNFCRVHSLAPCPSDWPLAVTGCCRYYILDLHAWYSVGCVTPRLWPCTWAVVWHVL